MQTNKTLVSILTTWDAPQCARAYHSAGDCDRVVIVNSLNPDHVSDVRKLLPDATIVETPCNGTPGQGKQSVWEYFLTTDYDYLILQEGDDWFYPGGVDVIKSWQNLYPSDCWWVTGEDIIYDNRYMTTWRDLDLDTILSHIGLTDAEFSEMHQHMSQGFELVTQRGYHHSRIIQINRHIAEQFKYDTDISGSEDVIMNADLKLSHLKSEITITVCETSEVCCYNKQISRGAGRNFMLGDSAKLRRSFYDHFPPSVIKTLRNSELCHRILPQTQSDRQRYRVHRKMQRSVCED